MATEVDPVIDPALEAIFEDPMVNNSVFDCIEARKTESTTGGVFDGTQYTSLVFDSKELSGFKDIHPGYLQLLLRLVKLDGSQLAAGAATPAAIADRAMEMVGCNMSPIKSLNLYINNIPVETIPKAFLRGILLDLLMKRTSDPVEASRWYYPEIHDVPTRGLIDGGNPSYAARVKRRTGNTVGSAMTFTQANPNMPLELRIPLTVFGYIRDNRAAIIGQEIRVEVTLADPGEGVCKAYLPIENGANMGNAVPNVRIKVEKAYMWYKVITPQSKYLSTILAGLNNNATLNRSWTQHEIFQIGTIDAVQGTASFNIPTKYSRFGRAFVFAQSVPRANSKTRQIFNPAVLDPVKWTNASIDYNGLKAFPNSAVPLEMNFDTREVTRPYEDFVAAQRKFQDEESGMMDFESYVKAYPYIVFDLSAPGNATLDQTSQTQLTINLAWKDSPVEQPTYANLPDTTGTIDANLPVGAPEYVNSTTDQKYVVYVCLEVERSLSGHGERGYTVFDQLSAI